MSTQNQSTITELRKTALTNPADYVREKMGRWPAYIRNLDEIFKKLDRELIIGLGIVPYSRVVLALILKNYLIFCARLCKDIKLIREFAKVVCVEERFPKIIPKIKSTGYLLKNFTFQNFIKGVKEPFSLFFYNVTTHIIGTLDETKWPYAGNRPETKDLVVVKSGFRQLLKDLGLPYIKNEQIPRQEFIRKNYQEVYSLFGTAFVCQRGDYDCGGEIATFFIHSEKDFKHVVEVFAADERFNIVSISPFIKGDTSSIAVCSTRHGVFTGPLQTQLIDIKESMRDYPGRGVFVGHDWGLRHWAPGTEEQAFRIAEAIGEYMYKTLKYKGIFGIDFIYDEQQNQLYPIECNPRFTGAFPVVSLLNIMNGTPPFDLLHLIEHKNFEVDYDLEKLKRDLRFKSDFSHILVTAQGIDKMPLDLPIGIYSYNEQENELIFERPAILPWEIRRKNEFLVVDSVFDKDAHLGDGAFKLFKLIFPNPIALNSYRLKPRYAKIVKIFSDLLYDNYGKR